MPNPYHVDYASYGNGSSKSSDYPLPKSLFTTALIRSISSLKMTTNLVSPTTIIFIIVFTVLSPNDFHKLVAVCQEDDPCRPARCSPTGPMVRFPFRLNSHQPEHCGFPGFDLTCSPANTIELNLSLTVRATKRNIPLQISSRVTVREIDYATQVIGIDVLNSSCLPARVTEPNPSSTSAIFEMYSAYGVARDGFTLFNCSEKPESRYFGGPLTCLARDDKFMVYPVRSFYSIADASLSSSCTKMYNISDVPEASLNGPSPYLTDPTQLHWSEPDCRRCETQRKLCRLSSNGRSNETECFELPEPPGQKKKELMRKVIIAASVVGSFLAAVAISALCTVYIQKRKKQRKQSRIRQFLEDYKALRPTRYTYAEIKRITDKFKHRLGQGGYGTVYRGIISNEIPVAVKVLHNIKGSGEDFINEVRTIGKIHHVNVVRLIGYCADGYRRALVYELLENDSLEKYIPSLHRRKSLVSWEKLHDIALGIAKGLDYLHQGCSQRILHFDIKPQNILLDHNLNPKVADFGLAKLCSKDKSVITMTAARGTIGYIAPEVFSRNFGRVSHKSDIYSYGMLLLDLVGGRRMFDNRGEDSVSEIYFPEWMYNQLDKGADIAVQIEKEEDSDVVKRLIIVGLWCIQWYPVDRPSTKVVIRMLEGEDMPIMPPNPFAASKSDDSTDAASTSGSDMFMSAETTLGSK